MAYDIQNPPSLITQGIGGGVALRRFEWVETNTVNAVTAPGYVENAESLGIQLGDIVLYKAMDGDTFTARALIVDDIDDAGKATLGLADAKGSVEGITRAEAQQKRIPASVASIQTNGYAAAGDGGAALHKRVTGTPAHDLWFPSADGAKWEFAEPTITLEQAGAQNDGNTPDDAAFDRAYAWCMAQPNGGTIKLLAGAGYPDSTQSIISIRTRRCACIGRTAPKSYVGSPGRGRSFSARPIRRTRRCAVSN